MAIRTIVKHPDPILREKAIQVRNFNANLHKLLDDMAETMYDADGVGLAAPQVGISKRVIVMDCGDGLIEVVNPEIIDHKGEQFDYPEGCLSIRDCAGMSAAINGSSCADKTATAMSLKWKRTTCCPVVPSTRLTI